jgi:hypothetical protein
MDSPASEKAPWDEPPEWTRGERWAGRVLCVVAFGANVCGGGAWLVVVVASAVLRAAFLPVHYLVFVAGVLGAVLFMVMGHLAGDLGRMMSGRAPRRPGRLVVRALIRESGDLAAGGIFLPVFLGSLVRFARGDAVAWVFLAAAALAGFGLPRLLRRVAKGL